MEPQIKREKKILRISLVGSIIFLLAEVLFAIITRSMAILMDCVYDIADLVMIGPFLALVPLLYKDETEKRPYGFAQVESLFVLIKYMILLTVDAVLIFNSIQLIFHGGNEVNASLVVYFELGISAACFAMYIILSRMNKKFSTPSLKAELFIWKLDAVSTLAVGVAFIVGLILGRTKLAFLVPYVDPGIAVILAAILLKEPIEMIIKSLRNLVLFAPGRDTYKKVKDIAQAKLKEYGNEVTFIDVIKTGRKIWVQVYFKPEGEIIDLRELKKANEETREELLKEFNHIDVELTPDIDYVRTEIDDPKEWRKEKLDYISYREEKKRLKKEKQKEHAH